MSALGHQVAMGCGSKACSSHPASPIPPAPDWDQSRIQEVKSRSQGGADFEFTFNTANHLSPTEEESVRGPGGTRRSVFCGRGWSGPDAVRPAWGRGGAAAQGGLASGSHPRGRRNSQWQQHRLREEAGTGLPGCPVTGIVQQPWTEESENRSLPRLWALLPEHFQFCFSACKN